MERYLEAKNLGRNWGAGAFVLAILGVPIRRCEFGCSKGIEKNLINGENRNDAARESNCNN